MMKMSKKQQHMYFKMDFSLDDDGMAYKTNRKDQSNLQIHYICTGRKNGAKSLQFRNH